MANWNTEQKGTQSLNKEIETVTLMVEYARERRDRCPHGKIQRRCEAFREAQSDKETRKR